MSRADIIRILDLRRVNTRTRKRPVVVLPKARYRSSPLFREMFRDPAFLWPLPELDHAGNTTPRTLPFHPITAMVRAFPASGNDALRVRTRRAQARRRRSAT